MIFIAVLNESQDPTSTVKEVVVPPFGGDLTSLFSTASSQTLLSRKKI
jgi:hypothetical protein